MERLGGFLAVGVMVSFLLGLMLGLSLERGAQEAKLRGLGYAIVTHIDMDGKTTYTIEKRGE